MKTLTSNQYNLFLTSIRIAVANFNALCRTDLSVEPLPKGRGLTIYFPTKAERWAAKVAREARAAANRGELTIEMHDQVTAVFVHKSRTSGISICSPDDSYDADIGIAIAYCRATGVYIPDYVC